ncbi:MAG: hypothetical protein KatS3mg131_2857 [Candidatus Tectimicrobiota bacterium]|nr:MAG: hypothetical protein KatS3mg131_2857 [Candidatus Tectomicrobia bacterium]
MRSYSAYTYTPCRAVCQGGMQYPDAIWFASPPYGMVLTVRVPASTHPPCRPFGGNSGKTHMSLDPLKAYGFTEHARFEMARRGITVDASQRVGQPYRVEYQVVPSD